MTRLAASRWRVSKPGCPTGQEGITLIELLVSMTILAVITTMIIAVWLSMQNSFAYSVDASHQREAARDAMAHMTVAIRDAQGASFTYPTGEVVAPAISVAEGSKIVFNTSYQRSGNASVSAGTGGNNIAVVQACIIYVPSASSPSDGKIYYVVDKDINGLTDELASTTPEGKILVEHVVNNVRPPTTYPTSVFTYTYFSDDGTMEQATSMSAAGVSPSRTYSVQIHVLVDLKPGKAPVYMDLQSTAQPRNLRPST